MLKRIISLCTTFVMLLAVLSPAASAAHLGNNQSFEQQIQDLSINYQDEAYRAENGISDIEITSEMRKAVSASCNDERGN